MWTHAASKTCSAVAPSVNSHFHLLAKTASPATHRFMSKTVAPNAMSHSHFHLLAKTATPATQTHRFKSTILSKNSPGSFYHEPEYTDEYQQKWCEFLDRPDIDGWELRQSINNLQGYDFLPNPELVISVLKACRRLNDYAVTVRYLEALKCKCGRHQNIYEYIVQEIRPTLDELGISLPEELGYDKPELACQSTADM